MDSVPTLTGLDPESDVLVYYLCCVSLNEAGRIPANMENSFLAPHGK